MNDRENARYEMFVRVTNFGTDNAADFPAGSEAAKHFAALAQITKNLETAKASQKPGGTTAKEVLMDALRLDVQNIVRTARAIAQDIPGFEDGFRLPASSSDADLLTAADAIILSINKPGVAAKFTAHALSATVAEDLAADRAAIDNAKQARESSRETGVASTAGIGKLVAAGIKEVNYLDAIMHNQYTRVADKLRAWKSASHTERAAQRQSVPAPEPATNPTPTA